MLTALCTAIINTTVMWYVCVKKQQKDKLTNKPSSADLSTAKSAVYEEIDTTDKTITFDMQTNVSYGPVKH